MNYARQHLILDPVKLSSWPLHIVGCGSAGSAAAQVLVKLGLGPVINLYDPQKVDDPNGPVQLPYREKDKNEYKVIALEQFLHQLRFGLKITAHRRLLNVNDRFEGIVVSGVDSMKSRALIWQCVQASCGFVPLYLDGRIGGEACELFTTRPMVREDREFYARWLFPDSEGARLPCGAEAIIHAPVELAARTSSTITRWARNESYYRRVFSNRCGRVFLEESLVAPIATS